MDISYETVRRWVLKFGPAIARNLRLSRSTPGDHWLWRAAAPAAIRGFGTIKDKSIAIARKHEAELLVRLKTIYDQRS